MHNNGAMEKHLLRQILARNLLRAMERQPGVDTQPGLAKRAGIAQSQVSRIIRGEIGVGLDILGALADALGMDPWELLLDEEATRRNVLERILARPGVPDPTPSRPTPSPPARVVAMKRRKHR